MHQIRFRLRLRPDPAGGAYSAPPEEGRTGWEGDGTEGIKGGGKEGREKTMLPPFLHDSTEYLFHQYSWSPH